MVDMTTTPATDLSALAVECGMLRHATGLDLNDADDRATLRDRLAAADETRPGMADAIIARYSDPEWTDAGMSGQDI